MRFELELAAVYLFSRRGRGHRSRLVRVTALGLAFGSFALVVSLALLAGFQEAVRREMRASAPGLVVRHPLGQEIPDGEDLEKRIAGLAGVGRVEARRTGLVWVVNRGNGSAAGVVLVESKTLADAQVVVDAEAASQLGAVVGTDLMLVSPREDLTPVGPVPRTASAWVVSYRAAAAPREHGRVEAAPDLFQRLLGVGAPNEIVIEPDPDVEPPLLRSAVNRLLQGSGLLTETPEQSQRALSAALELERLVLFAAIALVIVVAASGVATDLSLLAVERRGGAAILRTQGATAGSIRRLYLSVGGLVGIAGGVGGALIGAVTAWLLDRTGLIPLPEGLYTIDRLPFLVRQGDVAVAAGLTTLLALVAAVGPSRRAAAEDPAEVLRER